MPDKGILRALAEAWLRDGGRGKRLLDLSCGAGTTARMLAAHGAFVVATDYAPAGCSGDNIRYVGGVDLNDPLPFKSACFDGINLTEVIEHIEPRRKPVNRKRNRDSTFSTLGVLITTTPSSFTTRDISLIN